MDTQSTIPPAPPGAPSVPVWLNPVLSGLTLTFVLGAVYNFALWRGGVDADLKSLQDGQTTQVKKLEEISSQLQDLKSQVAYLQGQIGATTPNCPAKVAPSHLKKQGKVEDPGYEMNVVLR